MIGEHLSISEVRDIERGDYIVVELDDDCYWMQSEGRVSSVTEYDDGSMSIKHSNGRGTLKVPADGRKKMKVNGAARGARNLPVKGVYVK